MSVSLHRRLFYRFYAFLRSNYETTHAAAVRDVYRFDPSVALGHGVHLQGKVEIGPHTYVNPPGLIYGGERAKVKIGAWCAIANNVSIRAATHDLAMPTGPQARMVERDIIIGDRVWIGANAFIMPGVTIGDDAVIGANAVVTQDVPARHVVAGVPARKLKER